MEKKILVIATTFPRWNNDSTPRFVYDLSNRLTSSYNIIVTDQEICIFQARNIAEIML